MANDRKNATVPVFNTMFERSNIAAKLHYNQDYLQIEQKFIAKNKTILLFLSLFF